MKSRFEVAAGLNSPTIRASLTQDVSEEDCWPWLGHLTPNGYGASYVPGSLKKAAAHRLVWELLVGPLNPADVLDHVCHDPDRCSPGPGCPHRSCVNPRHLQVSTLGLNTLRGGGPTARNARKTVCKNGHPFDSENTVYRAGGGRTCRACAIERARQYTLDRGGRSRYGRRTVSDEELRKA